MEVPAPSLPLLFLQLIGQFQFVLLRAGQHDSDLLQAALVLRYVLRAAGRRSKLRPRWVGRKPRRTAPGVLPARAAPWGRSGPSPPHRCGWWPWPSRPAPCPSRPAAARCAAASPSGPPGARWCLRSCARSGTTSRSAREARGRTRTIRGELGGGRSNVILF